MNRKRIWSAVIIVNAIVTINAFSGTDRGFGIVTLSPAFELDGAGKNVDSMAFWETADPAETLMFVTGKDNNLLEVWKFPFLDNELVPLQFSSRVNGVVVDQQMDLLYVTEAGAKKVDVFSLPGLQLQREFGEGEIGTGETNIDILKHHDGRTLVYVTDDHNVHWFDAASGVWLGSFAPPVSSIETVLADDFHQLILVPEEQGPDGNPGVYAFHPDGTPFEKNGTNRFGSGEFDRDEEGILIYAFSSGGLADDGTGFIVVSDQVKSQTDFEFFDRQTWEHLGVLRLEGVANTDGIASTQQVLPDYPLGLFVAINDDNTTVGIGWDVIFEATGLLTGVKEKPAGLIPTKFALRQNYPNPFNPATTIEFTLPIQSFVNLKVFDVRGEEVITLVNTDLQPGDYRVNFDKSDEDISSGVYFFQIHVATNSGQNFIETKKLILLK